MAPIPDLGLVQHLARFDKTLRLRWATHQKCWLIEMKVEARNPAWFTERPNPMGTTPRAMDTWAGWREGYVYVTKLPHPITYPWAFIAQHLTHLSMEARHAKDALEARLNEVEREQDEAAKREWALQNETGAKELYDLLAWREKREISTYVAGPNPTMEQRDGYAVVDRRVTV